jgi:uncharacterized protein YmfQ (DUF2313 family)
MKHADVLTQLLPPSSYDANGVNLNVELNAVGLQLDSAMLSADLLRAEMHPDTTVYSLADYERVYGLPDECVAVAQSIEQREAALLSKMMAEGGQSKAYFIRVAQSMGYAGASIDEFLLMSCNSACDDALNSVDDLFTWQMNLPLSTGGVFQMNCNSECDSSIYSWGDGAIECRISHVKPVHTHVVFAYP